MSLGGPGLEQAPLGSRPMALILSGGAALGSWQAGVLYALAELRGFKFDSVVGSSAGSINGCAYFQGTLDLLQEFWRNVPGRSFMRLGPKFLPPSLFRQEPLREYLAGFVNEERARSLKRCWFHPVAADITHARMVQSSFSPEGDPWEGPLLDRILASIAVPVIFPPMRVGDSLFVDGHVSCFADLEPPLSRGALDFLFVNVAGRPSGEEEAGSIRRYLSLLINIIMRAQVDNALAVLRPRAEPLGLRFFEFTPLRPLRVRVFKFDRAECRAAFEQGLDEAERFLSAPGRFQVA